MAPKPKLKMRTKKHSKKASVSIGKDRHNKSTDTNAHGTNKENTKDRYNEDRTNAKNAAGASHDNDEHKASNIARSKTSTEENLSEGNALLLSEDTSFQISFCSAAHPILQILNRRLLPQANLCPFDSIGIEALSRIFLDSLDHFVESEQSHELARRLVVLPSEDMLKCVKNLDMSEIASRLFLSFLTVVKMPHSHKKIISGKSSVVHCHCWDCNWACDNPIIFDDDQSCARFFLDESWDRVSVDDDIWNKDKDLEWNGKAMHQLTSLLELVHVILTSPETPIARELEDHLLLVGLPQKVKVCQIVQTIIRDQEEAAKWMDPSRNPMICVLDQFMAKRSKYYPMLANHTSALLSSLASRRHEKVFSTIHITGQSLLADILSGAFFSLRFGREFTSVHQTALTTINTLPILWQSNSLEVAMLANKHPDELRICWILIWLLMTYLLWYENGDLYDSDIPSLWCPVNHMYADPEFLAKDPVTCAILGLLELISKWKTMLGDSYESLWNQCLEKSPILDATEEIECNWEKTMARKDETWHYGVTLFRDLLRGIRTPSSHSTSVFRSAGLPQRCGFPGCTTEDGTKICGACRCASYRCREHQVKHRQDHKLYCRLVELVRKSTEAAE